MTLLANSAAPLIEVQLAGFDPDKDAISYNLVSPSEGSGYSDAYVGSQSGRLYLTLDGSASSVTLEYNVSDGIFFSETAQVGIEIREEDGDHGLGMKEVDARTYASFRNLSPWGALLGAPNAAPTFPRSVDLSASFPVPGNQGRQGSCVGWAIAYAMKTYMEKVDQSWDLTSYNRMQEVGAATWDLMPYKDWDCTSQPSAEAIAQAQHFKIRSWGVLRTTDRVKAQLANHQAVIAGIGVFPSFERLAGRDSVYTDYSGENKDGHAVTLVGYDDDRYGGAFKVTNSWGTEWGDGGFFWLPYAYSVEDISGNYEPVDPVDPRPQEDELPNLEVLSWGLLYDPRPGGARSP